LTEHNADPAAPGRGSSMEKPEANAEGKMLKAGAEEAAGIRSGALGDVRVLDLTRLLPGGFCSLLLADLGADVVKVEDTGMGDYVRWAPPFYGDESKQGLGTRSALYLALNRGKRSLRLDLKSDGGRDAFLRLARHADVVIESFRPGVLDRLGCGYEALRATNPRLVYCAITGYGQTGPMTQRAGHDLNYLALNGLLGLTGEPGGRPIQPAGQIADLGGGALMAAVGVLAALRECERSGEGQLVDVSMTDGSLAWLAMTAAQYLCDGQVPKRGRGALTGGIACYLPYEAADGWVTCAALEPKFWRNLCEGVGRPDLIEHQFSTPGSEAWREIAAVFKERTREEWRAFNDEHDAMVEPVFDLDEALDSELVRARKMVVEVEQPELGAVRLLGAPLKLSRTPADPTRAAPALGEHTREVLGEAGIPDDEIEALLGSGAAAVASAEAQAGSFLR
jgi:alpha-methylacyl-CoA racemase